MNVSPFELLAYCSSFIICNMSFLIWHILNPDFPPPCVPSRSGCRRASSPSLRRGTKQEFWYSHSSFSSRTWVPHAGCWLSDLGCGVPCSDFAEGKLRKSSFWCYLIDPWQSWHPLIDIRSHFQVKGFCWSLLPTVLKPAYPKDQPACPTPVLCSWAGDIQQGACPQFITGF